MWGGEKLQREHKEYKQRTHYFPMTAHRLECFILRLAARPHDLTILNWKTRLRLSRFYLSLFQLALAAEYGWAQSAYVASSPIRWVINSRQLYRCLVNYVLALIRDARLCHTGNSLRPKTKKSCNFTCAN